MDHVRMLKNKANRRLNGNALSIDILKSLYMGLQFHLETCILKILVNKVQSHICVSGILEPISLIHTKDIKSELY